MLRKDIDRKTGLFLHREQDLSPKDSPNSLFLHIFAIMFHFM